MKKPVNFLLDVEILGLLKKRAKKEHLTAEEMIENIVRRSMVSYIGKKNSRDLKIDDKLVSVFSRQRSGRKRKGNKKK